MECHRSKSKSEMKGLRQQGESCKLLNRNLFHTSVENGRVKLLMAQVHSAAVGTKVSQNGRGSHLDWLEWDRGATWRQIKGYYTENKSTTTRYMATS